MTFPYVQADTRDEQGNILFSTATVLVGPNFTPYTLHSEQHPNFAAIKEAASNPATTVDQMLALVNDEAMVRHAVVEFKDLTVAGGAVIYRGEQVHGAMADKLVEVVRANAAVDAWLRFVNKVLENPREFSREELYLWLEKAGMPFTDEGNIVGYKVIREDYRDIYSGTFDNSVGRWVQLPGGPESVDPNRANTCSVGLHFCSASYLPHFGTSKGSRVVVVEIDPRDIVSIPNDYNNAKGRCWRYKVVAEIPREVAQTMIWPPVVRIENDVPDEDGVVVEGPETPEPEQTETVGGVTRFFQRFKFGKKKA